MKTSKDSETVVFNCNSAIDSTALYIVLYKHRAATAQTGLWSLIWIIYLSPVASHSCHPLLVYWRKLLFNRINLRGFPPLGLRCCRLLWMGVESQNCYRYWWDPRWTKCVIRQFSISDQDVYVNISLDGSKLNVAPNCTELILYSLQEFSEGSPRIVYSLRLKWKIISLDSLIG